LNSLVAPTAVDPHAEHLSDAIRSLAPFPLLSGPANFLCNSHSLSLSFVPIVHLTIPNLVDILSSPTFTLLSGLSHSLLQPDFPANHADTRLYPSRKVISAPIFEPSQSFSTQALFFFPLCFLPLKSPEYCSKVPLFFCISLCPFYCRFSTIELVFPPPPNTTDLLSVSVALWIASVTVQLTPPIPNTSHHT